MGSRAIIAFLLLLACSFTLGCKSYDGPAAAPIDAAMDNGDNITIREEVGTLRLTSSVFREGEAIPRRYTCQGENINPPLRWDSVPEGTKSFALIVDDPDAPGRTWVHWLVKDIPASAREIAESSVPGKEVLNSWGNARYGGPCPPTGVHRYFFKLYALNVSSFEARNSREFYEAVEKHKLGEAQLMGRYQKS